MAATTEKQRVTRDDIEAKLRELQRRGRLGRRAGEGADDRDRGRSRAVTIIASYWLGRRRGRRRQLILEIKRI